MSWPLKMREGTLKTTICNSIGNGGPASVTHVEGVPSLVCARVVKERTKRCGNRKARKESYYCFRVPQIVARSTMDE